MIGAAQRRLDIAENGVHPAKFGGLHARPSTADHDLLVSTARRGDAMEAGQPIRDHPSACAEVLLRPSSDFGVSGHYRRWLRGPAQCDGGS